MNLPFYKNAQSDSIVRIVEHWIEEHWYAGYLVHNSECGYESNSNQTKVVRGTMHATKQITEISEKLHFFNRASALNSIAFESYNAAKFEIQTWYIFYLQRVVVICVLNVAFFCKQTLVFL